MNNNETKTIRINLKDLVVGDMFAFPEHMTWCKVTFKSTMDNMTRIEYVAPGSSYASTFTKVNLTSVLVPAVY